MKETNTTLSQRLKEAKSLCEAELQKDTQEKILKEQKKQRELKRKAEEEETARKNAEAETIEERDKMITAVIIVTLNSVYITFGGNALLSVKCSIADFIDLVIAGYLGLFLVTLIGFVISHIVKKLL